MTPLKKVNSFREQYFTELGSDSYLKINIILAGVIMIIIIYSGIFSPDTNNYPVVCIHEKITGMKCFSCGLSHSFSLLLRGRIGEAYTWNIYGMQVFLFFVLQLFMRIAFSVLYIKNSSLGRQIILYDITGSSLLFLIAFFPFFRQLILQLAYTS